jgi:hypothetical protein
MVSLPQGGRHAKTKEDRENDGEMDVWGENKGQEIK